MKSRYKKEEGYDNDDSASDDGRTAGEYGGDDNIIVNGSFERPVIPASGEQTFTTGSSFAGWQVVGASGSVNIQSIAFQTDGFVFPAECGAQWIDLTGDSNTVTGIQQTVPTIAGNSYKLSFYVGNVYGPQYNLGVSSTVNVVVKIARRC